MKDYSALLHAENILRLPFSGKRIAKSMEARCQEIAASTSELPDHPLSVVIRSRNNTDYIESLLQDIQAQDYEAPVEIILVDTESTDGTPEIARKHGAKVITIKQVDFSYPKALNVGFKAARYPYVASLVGHSNLSNRYMFKCLTYWVSQKNFGGVYGWPLANSNASRTELFGIGGGQTSSHTKVKIEKAKSPTMGVLGANGMIMKRSVWEELGGFDERYAAGGEDSALGQVVLKKGYLIARDPLCAVLHSHGLGFVDNIRQLRHWFEISKPLPFDHDRLLKRRPDLRS